ncbi:ABC transporter permease subunit [Mesobacillus subterraneus]|uniref:ABC transporter permease subunit n=1 Tax=Mesobacillus subterraneus TaxID=285983 RepID=UPI001CFE8DF2|nr:ABC transporter permease subunit [Mesobacillus subterraneus]WLR53760.1 ABC transporter permease subunit [Mesobacillus subterraneus]
MKKIIHYLFLFLTFITGLLFFMVFPRLFVFRDPDSDHIGINLFSFFKLLGDTVMQFFKPASWQFFERWNTETVIDRYTYSLEVIFVSLIFSIVIGSLIAYLFMNFPYKQRSRVKNILNFFEGIPDLLVIFMIQMFLFTLYREFQIRLVTMYGLAGKEPLIFPMIINSLLPSLFFAQYLIKVMEEEFEKHYILLGQAKGLSKVQLLFSHLTRNIVPVVTIHFKTIIFMILTNLVLVEHMFVLDGYIQELNKLLQMKSTSPVSILFYVGVLMLPVILVERFVSLIGKKFGSLRGMDI